MFFWRSNIQIDREVQPERFREVKFQWIRLDTRVPLFKSLTSLLTRQFKEARNCSSIAELWKPASPWVQRFHPKLPRSRLMKHRIKKQQLFALREENFSSYLLSPSPRLGREGGRSQTKHHMGTGFHMAIFAWKFQM